MDTDAALIRDLAHRMAPALAAEPGMTADLWDLDEIFWQDYPKPWNVGRAVEAFQALIEYYEPWAKQLVALLQIWLPQTQNLCTEIPVLGEDILVDVSLDRPPAIGLMRKVRDLRPPYEHYQIPIQQSILRPLRGAIQAYYECFRSDEAAAMGEQYDRVLIFRQSE
jgi:hypothetical protein